MSTDALSRSRSPMRGSDGSVSEEAKWRAGYTYARRRARHRHPDRVADRAAAHVVPARQQREDRQAGGVGRRPALGPQLLRAQVPGRAGARVPGAALALAARTARTAGSARGRPAARGGRRRPRCGRPPGSGSRRGRTRRRSRSARARAACARVTRSNGMPIRDPVAAGAEVGVDAAVAADRGDHRVRVRRARAALSTRWLVENDAGKIGHGVADPARVGVRRARRRRGRRRRRAAACVLLRRDAQVVQGEARDVAPGGRGHRAAVDVALRLVDHDERQQPRVAAPARSRRTTRRTSSWSSRRRPGPASRPCPSCRRAGSSRSPRRRPCRPGRGRPRACRASPPTCGSERTRLPRRQRRRLGRRPT